MPFSQFFGATFSSGNTYCPCHFISPPAGHIQSPNARIHQEWFGSLWRLAYSPTLQQKLQSSMRQVTDLNQNQTILKKLYDDIVEVKSLHRLQNTLVCAEITPNDPVCFFIFYFFNKLNLNANQHLTFVFHKIFQGLPFHVIWDVADKHPVSFVHVPIGFKAPASASLLGSLLPAGVGFMLGFSVHFSAGGEQLWWSEKRTWNQSYHLEYKQKPTSQWRPLLARMRRLAASAMF